MGRSSVTSHDEEQTKRESLENEIRSRDISNLNGDSQENLALVINSYVETLSHGKMHALGNFNFMFLISLYMFDLQTIIYRVN